MAHTPVQQRCVGDQDNSGGAGKTPNALVFEEDPFSGLLAYPTSPVSFRHGKLMVFTTVCVCVGGALPSVPSLAVLDITAVNTLGMKVWVPMQ